jgi:hypothetical protein
LNGAEASGISCGLHRGGLFKLASSKQQLFEECTSLACHYNVCPAYGLRVCRYFYILCPWFIAYPLIFEGERFKIWFRFFVVASAGQFFAINAPQWKGETGGGLWDLANDDFFANGPGRY